MGVESTPEPLDEIMTSRPFTSRFLVDNVPLALRPFHDAFSYSLGSFLFAYSRLVYFTSRKEVVGRERIETRSNYIFCYWHVFMPMAICLFYRPRQHVWMLHPAWLAKHVSIVARLFGVEQIVFGSTGHRGREAADEVIEYLKEGFSTVVFPDAPRGPRFVAKDGVLHMSLKSGVPIAPVRFWVSRYVELKGWDRKRIPWPFNAMGAEFQLPILVTEKNFDEARERLIEALGVPEE